MLNPEVLNTSSHCRHTCMYNKKKQWIISFSYVKTLTSLGAQWWGGGHFSNQTEPILVHIYPLFNNRLHVKYRFIRRNLIRTFWVKMKKKILHVGPLHKVQGYQPGAPKCQQMQTSSQRRHMYNKGEQFENPFFIYGPKHKKNIFWAIWGGGGLQ